MTPPYEKIVKLILRMYHRMKIQKEKPPRFPGAVLSFEHKRDVKLIELSLVLTGSFRLLLTLQAGADVMLALLNFSDNALLGAATLKATQSAFQRLVFLDANFRHCFPSLRWHPAKSWMLSGPITLG